MDYHSLTAKQKGGVGEALLTSHTTEAADIVSSWVIADVESHFEETYEDIRISHDSRVETYYINYERNHMSWTPDCLFTARMRRGFGSLRSSGELRVDYPVEVKTGEYAELERNQRAVMSLLAQERDIVPVLANIDLEFLPEIFGISFTRITD